MNHSKQILWHIILISLMNAMTYIYAEFTFYMVTYPTLLQNTICNYLRYFTAFTFISHYKSIQ